VLGIKSGAWRALPVAALMAVAAISMTGAANAATMPTTSSSAPNVFKPYAGRWYSAEADLEVRKFTTKGVAHIEWAGPLPCSSSGCALKMTVRFTTRGHTKNVLHGTVSWVNRKAKAGHAFKVGEKVKLDGRPSRRFIVLVSPNSDSAALCRTIHAHKCSGEE